MTELTVRILQGIREDLQSFRGDFNGLRGDFNGLRRDFNGFREEMISFREETRDELRGLRQEMKYFAAHKERDTMRLADDVEDLRGRVTTCEERLGIKRS